METVKNKIVYMKFGSHLYGTNTPKSDLDYKGVFQADLRDIVLKRDAEHHVIKSNKTDERNTKDDTDVEYKELRTFLNEAMSGQTYALDMLFAPPEMVITSTVIWQRIIENRAKLLSKNLKPFIGYCTAQARKYGLKGDRLKVVEDLMKLLEPSLEEHAGKTLEDLIGIQLKIASFILPHTSLVKMLDAVHPNGGKVKYLQILDKKFDYKMKLKDIYASLKETYDQAGARAHAAKESGGVDFKALSHAYRCIFELEELVTTGKITFPLIQLQRVMDIKLGKVSYEEMNSELPTIIERVLAIDSPVLPEQPDRKFWDQFILESYGVKE